LGCSTTEIPEDQKWVLVLVPGIFFENFLENLPKTAAFFSEKDEVVNDNYKLKDKEFISIIPPIGGG